MIKTSPMVHKRQAIKSNLYSRLLPFWRLRSNLKATIVFRPEMTIAMYMRMRVATSVFAARTLLTSLRWRLRAASEDEFEEFEGVEEASIMDKVESTSSSSFTTAISWLRIDSIQPPGRLSAV